MKLLIDTSALVALLMKRDRLHRSAEDFVRAHPGARFVMTDLVLSETVTIVRMRGNAARAAEVARRLLESRRYEVVLLDRATLEGAVDQMARFSDKRLSLADCASFELMERLGLEAAFTYDEDFGNCGYAVVPGG